jgi:hypothetical protein
MNSAQLHEWIADYNWDDGLAPIWAIVDSPKTEFATALMIYWRLGGPWLKAEPGSVNDEAKRLQNLVQERLMTGFYAQGSSRFDPSAELSRSQLYQLRKAGLPALLLGLALNPLLAPGRCHLRQLLR